jgi:hypothetical protein
MDSRRHPRVREGFALPEAAGDRLIDALPFVKVGKRVIDRGAGNVGRDPHRMEAPKHTQPSPSAEVRFGARVRPGGPRIVECAFGSEPGDGGVYLVWLESSRQAFTQLRLGKFTGRQKLQAHRVGALALPGHPLSLRELRVAANRIAVRQGFDVFCRRRHGGGLVVQRAAMSGSSRDGVPGAGAGRAVRQR